MEAMKNLSIVETHKLDKLLLNQKKLVRDLENTAADFLKFHPFPFPDSGNETVIWIVFGSERGFCGDYNDTLLKHIDALFPADDESILLIPVGNKLCSRLQDDQRVVCFAKGPDVVEEVMTVQNLLIEQINALQSRSSFVTVHALYHQADTRKIKSSRLIPPFEDNLSIEISFNVQPLLNISPDSLYHGLVDHYLLITLHEIICMSLLAENYQRVEHMTNAIERLNKKEEGLRRKYHVYNQEEITEELEVILLNTIGS